MEYCLWWAQVLSGVARLDFHVVQLVAIGFALFQVANVILPQSHAALCWLLYQQL